MIPPIADAAQTPTKTHFAPAASGYYDVIIVGARVAGAATAALLAAQGARVLLLERATFPARTLSSPVFFGNSMAVLERIGVLDDLERLDVPRILHYGVRMPDFDLVARLPASHGRDYAYSIRRDTMDDLVLRRVATSPHMTVRQGFNVDSLVWGAGRVVGVRGRQQGQSCETLYAQAVIGADGKRSLVGRLVEAPIYESHPNPHCLYYAYYRDFRPLAEPSAIAYVSLATMRGVMTFDADSGLTAVSMGVPDDQFAEVRKDPAAALEAVIQEYPEVADRRRGATRVTPVMGQGPVASFYRQSYGPGWALVGDAGHYIDPSSGQGINNALRGAELLAAAWERLHRPGARVGWMQAMADYQRQRDAETRPMYDLYHLSDTMNIAGSVGLDLTTPLLRALTRRPAITQRYVGMYNGATPIAEFMHPAHLARLIAEDTLRYEVPHQAAELVRRMLPLPVGGVQPAAG